MVRKALKRYSEHEVCGGNTSQYFTVDFSLNNSPILNPISSHSINKGDLLEFTTSAIDPDGSVLEILAKGLPEGATFYNNGNGTGRFSWQTNYNDAGIYHITFIVSDGELGDSEEIEIAVCVQDTIPPSAIMDLD